MLGEPICVSTLSSHCRGPFRCSSIQQGVLVTVCLLGEQNQMLETNRGGGGGGVGSGTNKLGKMKTLLTLKLSYCVEI